MIQINLLPKDERPIEPRFSVQVPRARIWIPAVVGAAILFPLGGMLMLQHARITSLRSDISQTEQEMRGLGPQIERIQKLEAEREQLNQRLTVIQGLARERYVAVETMDHLADQVPEGLWLTKLTQSGPSQITIEGLTFSNLQVAELMSRMEHSDLFEGVALTVAERAKTGLPTRREVLSFALSARVKP